MSQLSDVLVLASAVADSDVSVGGDSARGITTAHIGPWAFTFDGDLEVASADATSRHIVIRFSGGDSRRASTIRALATVDVRDVGGGCQVRISTDAVLTGAVGPFSHSVIEQALDRGFVRVLHRLGEPNPVSLGVHLAEPQFEQTAVDVQGNRSELLVAAGTDGSTPHGLAAEHAENGAANGTSSSEASSHAQVGDHVAGAHLSERPRGWRRKR